MNDPHDRIKGFFQFAEESRPKSLRYIPPTTPSALPVAVTPVPVIEKTEEEPSRRDFYANKGFTRAQLYAAMDYCTQLIEYQNNRHEHLFNVNGVRKKVKKYLERIDRLNTIVVLPENLPEKPTGRADPTNGGYMDPSISVFLPRFSRRPNLHEYDRRRDPGQMDRYRFGIYPNSSFGD